MAQLRIQIEGFTGTRLALNGVTTIDVSRVRALKFATTVGLPMLTAATPRSQQAVSLAAYKALAIQCAMDFTTPSVSRPPEYEQMDPSEKGNISYWIGMTTAAVVSNDILNAPRMLHAAGFGGGRVVRTNAASRRLADLVGQEAAGQWHVVEAKARQGEPSPGKRAVWKDQALSIATVDGSIPETRSYLLARVGPTYSAELVDPSPDDTDTDSADRRSIRKGVDLTSEPVFARFYEPLREWLSRDTRVVVREGVRMRVRAAAYDSDAGEYILVGLSDLALESIADRQLPKLGRSLETHDAFLGGDGVAVLTTPQLAP